jgi:hypothetical protein
MLTYAAAAIALAARSRPRNTCYYICARAIAAAAYVSMRMHAYAYSCSLSPPKHVLLYMCSSCYTYIVILLHTFPSYYYICRRGRAACCCCSTCRRRRTYADVCCRRSTIPADAAELLAAAPHIPHAGARRARRKRPGTLAFASFTGTKVQILTQLCHTLEHAARSESFQVLSLLASLAQKYKY